MTIMVKELKSQRFVARVTAADKQLFQMAAAMEGRSLTQFILTHAREIAHQVVYRQQQIQLDTDQSRQLVEALLAPPRKPTVALKKAMARYRRQVTEA